MKIHGLPQNHNEDHGWDDNTCLGVRNTSSIGAWPNSLDRRPPWYFIVSPLLQTKHLIRKVAFRYIWHRLVWRVTFLAIFWNCSLCFYCFGKFIRFMLSSFVTGSLFVSLLCFRCVCMLDSVPDLIFMLEITIHLLI